MDTLSIIKTKVKIISYLLRSKYYTLFYDIGKGCLFQKIYFTPSINGGMGKHSIKIGNHVTIFKNTELVAFDNFPIVIGDGTFLNRRCHVSPNTYLGSNVSVGHSVSLITDSHEIGTTDRRAGKPIFPKIIVEDGCWIGANSTILGGVTIGKGTIIAAGSVVTKDCEPNSLYAGVPARLIKKLN